MLIHHSWHIPWIINSEFATEHGPFIGDLPINMVIFHGYVNVCQRLWLLRLENVQQWPGWLANPLYLEALVGNSWNLHGEFLHVQVLWNHKVPSALENGPVEIVRFPIHGTVIFRGFYPSIIPLNPLILVFQNGIPRSWKIIPNT